MDHNDIIDLLTIVQASDNRSVGDPEIELWHRILGHLDKDDCTDAIMAHRRECPGVWLEPGHIVQRVKAVIKDRYERADTDIRDRGRPVPAGVRRDHYGYIDKSEPEEEDPPGWATWDSEKRVRYYWQQLDAKRQAGRRYD